MRACGETSASDGFGVHDHMCWGFHGTADLVPAVVEFLAEGIELGLRVEVDAGDVAFFDHQALLTLDAHGRGQRDDLAPQRR